MKMFTVLLSVKVSKGLLLGRQGQGILYLIFKN